MMLSNPNIPAFDITKALVIIAAWPDGRCMPEIPIRLMEWGVPADHIVKHWEWSPIDTAYNLAVQEIALQSHRRHEWFIFCDNDVTPGLATAPFVLLGNGLADVVGCLYDVESNATWGEPTRIHTGLWRTHRRVLDALGYPWFRTIRTADGHVSRCCCEFFRSRIQTAGFRIARAGFADHVPKYGPHAREKPCGRRAS